MTVNSDLFWAVRGGTGGNFGVLLNAEYKIQKLDKVYGWSILWPLSTAAERKVASEAMLAIQKDFFRAAPPEFNIQIAVCYQPPKKGAKVVPQLVVRGLYVGTEEAGQAPRSTRSAISRARTFNMSVSTPSSRSTTSC